MIVSSASTEQSAPSVDAFGRESPGAAPRPRRLLLLSWHFPPDPSVGANRWEQLARYAVARGWEMDVVTLRRAASDPAAVARLAALPPEVRVVGFDRPREPLDDRIVREVLRWVRGGARREPAGRGSDAPRPDAGAATAPGATPASRGGRARALYRAYFSRALSRLERGWARAAERTATALVAQRPPTLVVSSGPPHMIHLAAARIARRTGAPHVVDMRDPWSLNELVPDDVASPWLFAENARMEAAVLADAALVVANTPSAAEALRRLYPTHAGRVRTVMNGHDFATTPTTGARDCFRIAYAGAVYADRSPGALFEALQRLRAAGRIDFSRVRVEIMGTVDPSPDALRALATRHGMDDVFTLHPPQPRPVAARFLESASVLLSLPQSAHLAIPSKIFEYSAYPAWMLVLAKAGSATADVLVGTSADVVDPDDPAGIAEVLAARYDAWAAGTIPAPVDADGRFSRRHQAELLFDALDELAPAHA